MNPYIGRSYYKTFRDAPADAETISNQLMMRAGLLKKHAPGIFSYTPLMTRAIVKVTNHIRDVFDSIGWEECLMPAVIPSELWKETGRWDKFGDQLLRFKDRKGADYCMGPTHEEVVTDLARYILNSYKQLPFTLYQTQTKFRDEIRPRFGVMRAREFIMMDGYSFHTDNADLDRHYEEVHRAYCELFDRLQLKYRAVEADTGAIGGRDSHEFHVLADSGEDLLLWCDKCSYAANVERAERALETAKVPPTEPAPAIAEVPTPRAVSIADVCKQLGIPASRTMKAVVLTNPFTDELMGVVVRGDREVSITKIGAKFGWAGVEAASDDVLRAKFKVEPGAYSPVAMKGLKWVVDGSLIPGFSYVAGSGKKDTHLTGVTVGRDVPAEDRMDVSVAKEKDGCPRCKEGKYKSSRGIEVGHIFKLGDKYSKSMGLTYLTADGKSVTPIMGCYGIGVTRVIAACIEQNHDKDGIKFPPSITPIDLHVIPLVALEGEAKRIVDECITRGRRARAHVAVDDRDLTPGVKMKDADLTGSPWHMVLGKKLAEGAVELKNRMTGERTDVPVAKLGETLDKIFAKDRG